MRRELHETGFHDRAAASKPYITKNNAKCRMQWCKALCHMDSVVANHDCMAIWWTSLGLAVARKKSWVM